MCVCVCVCMFAQRGVASSDAVTWGTCSPVFWVLPAGCSAARFVRVSGCWWPVLRDLGMGVGVGPLVHVLVWMCSGAGSYSVFRNRNTAYPDSMFGIRISRFRNAQNVAG